MTALDNQLLTVGIYLWGDFVIGVIFFPAKEKVAINAY
jgi:hypothetical protein